MLKSMLVTVTIIALVYLGLLGALYFLQRSMIYFPTPPTTRAGVDSWQFPVDGAQLEVTTSRRSGSKALLYFGGNAEDVSVSLPELELAFPERSLFLMHYRGYGHSTGKPSETALVADARALHDAVRADHDDVWVMGRSLGSGVAVQLAASHDVRRLILVTPYDSIQRIAQRQFPIIPVSWILRDKYESWRYAGSLDVPTLLIVAERDEVIPHVRSEGLFEAFSPGVAAMEIIEGAGHNTISEFRSYRALLAGLRE